MEVGVDVEVDVGVDVEVERVGLIGDVKVCWYFLEDLIGNLTSLMPSKSTIERCNLPEYVISKFCSLLVGVMRNAPPDLSSLVILAQSFSMTSWEREPIKTPGLSSIIQRVSSPRRE